MVVRIHSEATRFGCNVLYGLNISNFKEIYNFLSEKKIAYKIKNQSAMATQLSNLFSRKYFHKNTKQAKGFRAENFRSNI